MLLKRSIFLIYAVFFSVQPSFADSDSKASNNGSTNNIQSISNLKKSEVSIDSFKIIPKKEGVFGDVSDYFSKNNMPPISVLATFDYHPGFYHAVLASGDYFIVSKDFNFHFSVEDSSFNLKDGSLDVTSLLKAKNWSMNFSEIKSESISYKAPNEKYNIYVFTDITCYYCQKLHSHIKEYNDLGISVHYFSFIRQMSKNNIKDIQDIWFSSNPNLEFNKRIAVIGKKALGDSSSDYTGSVVKKFSMVSLNPDFYMDHYRFGSKFGVRGTPSIFLENGSKGRGYMEPKDMLKFLEQNYNK